MVVRSLLPSVPIPLLQSQLFVDLSDVLFTWEGKVFGLYYGPVDVLALHLSHFLFVLNTQELAYELGVNGQNLYQLVPKLKDLAAHEVNVLHQQERNLVRVVELNSLGEGYQSVSLVKA